jgi:signal transduction histidine kinase
MTGAAPIMHAVGRVAAGVLSAAAAVARRTAPDQEESLRRLRHELRTPLASVTALTAALDEGTALDGDERRELARLAHWQAEHMADLVNGPAAAVRGPRQRRLAEVVTAASVAAGVPRTRLEVRLDPAVAALPVCRRTVQQVLTNLLENAVRHGPADGAVRVTGRLDGDVLVLGVADAGRPTEALRQALQGHGHGLGVRIVQGLVAETEGSLRLAQPADRVVLEARLPGYGGTGAGCSLAD